MSADPQPRPPCKPNGKSFGQSLGRAARVVAAGGLVAAIVLAFIPPSDRPTLSADAETRGAALEQALIAAVTKVRDPAGESWAIAIDPADINAWLATRLPKWVAHDPEFASFADAAEVRVGSEDGALVVESLVGPRALGLVGTVRVPIELAEGEAQVRADIGSVRIGRLPVPLVEIGLVDAARVIAEVKRLESRYPGRRFRLGDGRFVQVQAISCERGRIKVRLSTLPAGASEG